MLNDYLDWPGLGQVYRLERKFDWLRRGKVYKTCCQIEYGITSLSRNQASPPLIAILEKAISLYSIQNSIPPTKQYNSPIIRFKEHAGADEELMITVGFAQFSPLRYHVEQNIASLKKLLAGVKADVLVLPELANSGYMYATPDELAPFAEEPDGHGPFLSALREIAGAIGGVIVTGFAEKSAGRLYNSAAAVDFAGVIQVYRKTHLFSDENDLFTPGDSGFGVFEYRQARIGMMVCFDWFFPEAARSLALKGAQIIAHPANLVLPYCQLGMVTRSLENVVFSITCNRYGVEQIGQKSLRFTGCSQVLDTKGNLLFQAPAEGDNVYCCEIDPAIANNKKINPHNDLFAGRRPDLYSL